MATKRKPTKSDKAENAVNTSSFIADLIGIIRSFFTH